MRKVYPYHFNVGNNTPPSSIYLKIYGKRFLDIRNLYVSGSNIDMFENVTTFDPFSSRKLKQHLAYPSFDAIIVPEFEISSENIISFNLPQTPKTVGYIDVIIENEAGYGKLTIDSRMPFISSYVGAVDIQNPWVDGIIINSDFDDPINPLLIILVDYQGIDYYSKGFNTQHLGKYYNLKVVDYFGNDIPNIVWSTDDSNIINVDQSGKITSWTSGGVTISATFFEFVNDIDLTMQTISSNFIDDIYQIGKYISTDYFVYNFDGTILTEQLENVLTEQLENIVFDNPPIGSVETLYTTISVMTLDIDIVDMSFNGPVTSVDGRYRAVDSGYFGISADFGTNVLTYLIPLTSYTYYTPYIYLSLINPVTSSYITTSSYLDMYQDLLIYGKSWNISSFNIDNLLSLESLYFGISGPVIISDDYRVISTDNGLFNIYLSGSPMGDHIYNITDESMIFGIPSSSNVLFDSNSLAYHIDNEVQKRLVGKASSAFVPLYNFHPQMSYYTSNTYSQRNINHWMADVDMSFYSIGKNNTTSNSRSRATLISPDICIFSRHYQSNLAFPVTITWRSSAGAAHTGYITSSANTIGYDGSYFGGDIVIAKLLSAISSDIQPATLLPPDWNLYLPNSFSINGVNGTQDHEYAPVRYRMTFPTSVSGTSRTDNWQCFGYSGNGGALVGGDSSSPEGFIVNDDYILFGLSMFSNFGIGGLLSYYYDILYEKALELGSTYPIKKADFSEFPKYSQ